MTDRTSGVVLQGALSTPSCAALLFAGKPLSRPFDCAGRASAAKAEMVGAAGDFAFAAAAHQVAAAILAGAQERPASQHAFLLVRFAGIEGRIGSMRIAR